MSDSSARPTALSGATLHTVSAYDVRVWQQLSKFLNDIYPRMIKAGLTDEEMDSTVLRLLHGTSQERWNL